MAGSVIQATGKAKFEDSLRIGNQSELETVISEMHATIDSRGGVDQFPLGR